MKLPLAHADFQLDVSGIAGFFGGEEAFAAISSVHLIRGRRWLGWYNSPGSYFVAKKYGVLARSRIWDGLYPGVNVDPARMLELDGKSGPRYVGLHSGTRLHATGHLAYLFEQLCAKEREKYVRRLHEREERAKQEEDANRGPEALEKDAEQGSEERRQKVNRDPPPKLMLTIAHLDEFEIPQKPKDLNKSTKSDGSMDVPGHSFSPFNPSSLLAIGYSCGACALCGVYRDWFCFAMILLGILCNGISCLVIGSGVLRIELTNPSPNSPPGDGILDGKEDFILLKGSERSVTTLTKGKFYLHYSSESQYHDIGFSAAALTTQFLVQLFIIPQGTLFGQIMFLSSLAASWIHNAYLASLDSEVLQSGILSKLLLRTSKLQRIPFHKRTAIVVFAATYTKPQDPRNFLDEMIPNNTPVWNLLKSTITDAISEGKNPRMFAEQYKSQEIRKLPAQDARLVWDMLEQASVGFQRAQEVLPEVRRGG